MNQKEELESTFIEEYSSALLLIKLQKRKSALILLSKSLFALADYFIYSDTMTLPKNHSERFRILKETDKNTYAILDEVWNKYTETYSKPAMSESISMIKNGIKKICENNERVSEKIKKAVNE